MHYILSSLFVALLWSFGIIVDSHICRKHFMGGFFIRLACFGIALPFIYLLMKDDIQSDIEDLWVNHRENLYIFIFKCLVVGIFANYFYYYSYNKSKGKSHIVIPITLILPSILAIIGTSQILKEKIKPISIVGIVFIIIGSYILIKNNK